MAAWALVQEPLIRDPLSIGVVYDPVVLTQYFSLSAYLSQPPAVKLIVSLFGVHSCTLHSCRTGTGTGTLNHDSLCRVLTHHSKKKFP